MTHEELVEEMKREARENLKSEDVNGFTVYSGLSLDIDTLITTTAQRVQEETIEEIKAKLDWRNRKDGTQFHDGSDVVDWYDKVLSTLNK